MNFDETSMLKDSVMYKEKDNQIIFEILKINFGAS